MLDNYTYILRCSDGTLYTGWTNNPIKRIIAHNSAKGAKYTKTRLPVYITYLEKFDSKEEAMSREWHIKQLTKDKKEKLIKDQGIVQLRPHHLLCIQLFEGKGYSPEFVKNMFDTIDRLNSNPDIMLTSTCDTLCSECPNSKGPVCITEEKIQTYDKNVLKETHLEEGKIYKWNDASRIAADLILDKGIIQEVCVDCGWKDICYKKAEERRN